ncbi:serine hydrolase domain-containing protein [Nocardioides sp. QY071]|uniref:serine hydrolase domain-containing protein n=1 Tax=Nocardioides sp. QY071 TaxID=3044187 RepID=UPI00249BA5A0|nr:serine hydrolase domain-containing protein [Nocardioides sp. QY071]WGY04630.1 serine hydrolase domain-containing protein [Nocardioides sp. QY071]
MSALLDTTAAAALRQVATAQAEGRLPSVAAGVVRDGELVWSAGRGRHVRRDSDARPDSDTQYKIGSVTKTMTAALILLARQRGQLALDDRVGRFWPEGPFGEATLRSLLTHSSGITAEPHGSWWERSDGGDLVALAAAHQGAGTTLEPGAQMHYSNLGYGLLGAVVDRVWGVSWWEALQAEILGPLAMSRTTYQWVEPAAEGFAVDALTGEAIPDRLPDTGAMAPAGQLWSTVGDLATWLTALVDPDRSVLDAATLRAMATPQHGDPDDRSGQSWGLGIEIARSRGRKLVGHAGSMPGFCCGAMIDSASGVGAIVLTNGAYGLGAATSELVHLVLDQEPPLPEEWTPTTVPVPTAVRELLGTWHWGHAPTVLRWDGTELTAGPPQGPGREMAFAPVGDGTFRGTSGYLAGELLRPHRRADGAIGHIECATFIWTRTPYDPQAPIPGGTAPQS